MSSVDSIISFLQDTFSAAKASQAVIAVSGGIDSAVSLSLVTRALGSANVLPVLLPYATQSTTDARLICDWNQIPKDNVLEANIQGAVTQLAELLGVTNDEVRLGNIMARVRMIVVFDRAKARSALVVGTENKSEHYLGYFTRFGDGASDIEPIVHLYKTQVREVARVLQIPDIFLTKDPTAGLWANQTDEQELGFTYEQADKVLKQLIDEHISPTEIKIPDVPADIVRRVTQRVQSQAFKLQVPYKLNSLKKI